MNSNFISECCEEKAYSIQKKKFLSVKTERQDNYKLFHKLKKLLKLFSEVLKNNKMVNGSPGPSGVDSLQMLSAQISEIAAQLQTSEQRRQQLETRIDAMAHPIPTEHDDLNDSGSFDWDGINIDTPKCTEPDITPDITSGDQIQLESYKAIPEFSGKQHEYRSWRNQVVRRMKIIDAFKKHPKYEAALGIVRAKITGAAADIITNNKTPYNIICIIIALDSAYTDQRPLYAIEAQMESIKQGDKSLHQFYNSINFALNAIITKVVQSYRNEREQYSLIQEAQKKAIRTFIVGMKFRMMRHILYGRQPRTLEEAYAIAQTVFHDNEYLQLEQCTNPRGPTRQQMNNYAPPKMYNANPPRNNMNWNYNANQQRNNINWNQPRYNVPEPMEVDTSHRTRQTPNWRQPDSPQKREYVSSRQQQPQKMQRINRLLDTAIPEERTANNDSDDSTKTNMSSAFLDE